MDNLEIQKYRNRTRIVAFIDLVLTSMTLLVPVTLFIGALGVSIVPADEIEGATKQDLNAAAWILWIAFALALLVVGIQMAAAVKLLNASQIGQEPKKAASLARCWRNVTITFTILSLVGTVSRMSTSPFYETLFSVVTILIRAIALSIVQTFIAHMDEAAVATLPSLQVQVGPVQVSAPKNFNFRGGVGMDGLPRYEELTNGNGKQ